MENFVKKNGLLYSADLHTVLGVDISNNAFTGRIPFGAHFIDDEVFCECPYESFSIPDSVKKIGKRQFENSNALESVKLPSTIQELPSYLFAGCEALTKVKMPDNLSVFPEGLFMGCSSLKEIPFKAGVIVLSKNVFANCASVKNLIFPTSVKKIESNACSGCTSLESVVFPSGIEEIALDAFENCPSLHSIRIDGESTIFYVSEEDGSLYKIDNNQLILKISNPKNDGIGFYKENVDDEPIQESEDDDFEEDDTLEDDTFFSCEIGASEKEMEIAELEDKHIREEKTMDNSNVNDMLAEIMGDENKRINAVPKNVSISEQESEALSNTIKVMDENHQNTKDGDLSQDELEKLFAKHEENFIKENEKVINPDEIDSKSQILINSVEFSKVLRFEPKESVSEDNELIVIAEKTITNKDGKEDFSAKLIKCCNSFANFKDYKKVIMLKGLPIDDEEFMQFYYHYISKKNIIFACEAESPSKLSDYGKTICEKSNISLDRMELNEQRKYSMVKSNMLVKLVVKDIYES